MKIFLIDFFKNQIKTCNKPQIIKKTDAPCHNPAIDIEIIIFE